MAHSTSENMIFLDYSIQLLMHECINIANVASGEVGAYFNQYMNSQV